MSNVKQPCVAGYFYPAEPTILAKTINTLLDTAQNTDIMAPKAIIAPHAGYIYSGPIAATIYKTLLPVKDKIKKVILLGPAHRVSFQGIATTSMEYFATPLGVTPIDIDSAKLISKLPGGVIFDAAYEMEHSLEVQLPFLQTIITSFKLVPCVVGNAKPDDVANLLLNLWGGTETLVVVSSDLSHYHNYDNAQKLDLTTTQSILNLTAENITAGAACGCLPIQGLLLAAKKLQLRAQVLDLRNSGDTASDKKRVVGYGAYHFV